MSIQELIAASLIPTMAIILLILYIRRSIPNLMQNVLNDVGSQITDIIAEPNVKRAMSILGSKSGEVRADNALRTKAADAIVGQSPVIERILSEIDITPLEGLKLMNDPIFGPYIQTAIQKFTEGISGGGGSSNSGGIP